MEDKREFVLCFEEVYEEQDKPKEIGTNIYDSEKGVMENVKKMVSFFRDDGAMEEVDNLNLEQYKD